MIQEYRSIIKNMSGMWFQDLKGGLSIIKNDVWDVVPRPEGKSRVSSKWIYKIKHATDGSIEKYKARFVVSPRKRA